MRIVSMSDQIYNALVMFMDRVPLQGHAERHAMNDIEQALNNPIKPERKDKDGEKTPGGAPVPAGENK